MRRVHVDFDLNIICDFLGKVSMQKFLFFTIFLLLSGCSTKCIEGGAGSSGSRTTIDVHARMPNSDESRPASFWKDSGVSVSDTETVKILIDGAVSMCPDSEYATYDVIVPAMFCPDGSIPSFTPDGSIEPSVTCQGASYYGAEGFYVDTPVSVAGGDHLQFSLIKKREMIQSDCVLPNHSKADELYATANSNNPNVSRQSACMNPGRYKVYMFEQAQLSPETMDINLVGRQAEATVTNDMSPYGNKVHQSCNSPTCAGAWLPGVDFDFRTFKASITPSTVNLAKGACSTVNYTRDIYDALAEDPIVGRAVNPSFFNGNAPVQNGAFGKDHPLVKVLDTYKLNCWCNKICGVKDGVYSSSQECFASMIYKPSDTSDKSCQTLFDPDIGALVNQLPQFSTGGRGNADNNLDVDPQRKTPIPFAGLLSAKIGGSEAGYQAHASQCIPKRPSGVSCLDLGNDGSDNQTLEYRAMPLEKFIKIDDKVPNNSKLMLGIMDLESHYSDNVGGYNVRVTKTCSVGGGKRLYMYIGDKAPDFLPGEAGSIDMSANNKGSGSGGFSFEVNKDNPPAKGRLFFAVDTRGYSTDHFLGSNIQYEMKNSNKYRVHVFQTIWNPNFSKLFVSLRDVLLKVFYGTEGVSLIDGAQPDSVLSTFDGEGVVKKLYINYVTGGRMWLFVRTVIIMYVMYTAVGYLLGVINMSIPDLIIRLTKIAIVTTAFSPSSWDLFGEILFGIFVDGATDLISVFSGYLGADNSFAFLDNTVGVLLAGETWLRFASLITSGPLGWLVFLMIIWSCYIFFTAIFKAMLGYLMLIIGMAFLMILAPLFISFLMFQRTKQLFDGWVRMLLNFMLQPIFVFAIFAFLNQIVLAGLYQMTSFTACPTCGLNIEVHFAGNDGKYCLFHYLSPVGYTHDTSINETLKNAESQNVPQQESFIGLPVGFIYILLFYIVSSAMLQFVNVAELLANSLSSVFGPIGIAAHGASQALLSVVGLDDETRQMIKMATKQKSIDPSKVELKSKRSDTGDSKEKGLPSGKVADKRSGTGEGKPLQDMLKGLTNPSGTSPSEISSSEISSSGSSPSAAASDSIISADGASSSMLGLATGRTLADLSQPDPVARSPDSELLSAGSDNRSFGGDTDIRQDASGPASDANILRDASDSRGDTAGSSGGSDTDIRRDASGPSGDANIFKDASDSRGDTGGSSGGGDRSSASTNNTIEVTAEVHRSANDAAMRGIESDPLDRTSPGIDNVADSGMSGSDGSGSGGAEGASGDPSSKRRR